MKLETLRSYIAMGREIEFSFHSERYSITYTFDKEKQTISFCQFNKSSRDYHSVDDFLASATVEDKKMQDILSQFEDIVVY